MKVGFLSIGNSSVDMREARITLFDCGHSAEMFLTVEPSQTEWGYNQLRSMCDAIAVEGDTSAFYNLYSDTLQGKPETFESDGKLFAVTPEITPEYIVGELIPLLNSKTKGTKFEVVVFKTFGKTEDELKVMLKDYQKGRSKVKFGFFPEFLECEVHARCSSKIPKTELTEISDKLNDILYQCTYSYERITIAERVAQMLTEQKLKLKLAESFTGGALAREFTKIPGASNYLVEGLVTYAVSSKIKRLGVPAQVISEKGVVSSDTAYHMAAGLIASGDCDIAIATTGNAGPTIGGNESVGTCFIALGDQKEVHTMRYTFDGSRDMVTSRGVKSALFLLYSYLDHRSIMLDQDGADGQ